MVTDRLTDIVYFSEWALKDFPVPINNICKLLDKYGIKYGLPAPYQRLLVQGLYAHTS